MVTGHLPSVASASSSNLANAEIAAPTPCRSGPSAASREICCPLAQVIPTRCGNDRTGMSRLFRDVCPGFSMAVSHQLSAPCRFIGLTPGPHLALSRMLGHRVGTAAPADVLCHRGLSLVPMNFVWGVIQRVRPSSQGDEIKGCAREALGPFFGHRPDCRGPALSRDKLQRQELASRQDRVGTADLAGRRHLRR